MASPVESNSVTSCGPERPGAAPVSTAPSSVTSLARHEPGLDGAGELAAVARLGPLVAEQLRAGDRLGLRLGLAGAVGARAC